MNKVFVYGTLKMGFGNHRLLENSELLGEETTDPRYTMVSLGGFPGVLKGGNTKIHGEVYAVNELTMKHLDRLEGYPNFYNRKTIETKYGDAWIYYLPRDQYLGYCKVEDGVWK